MQKTYSLIITRSDGVQNEVAFDLTKIVQSLPAVVFNEAEDFFQSLKNSVDEIENEPFDPDHITIMGIKTKVE